MTDKAKKQNAETTTTPSPQEDSGTGLLDLAVQKTESREEVKRMGAWNATEGNMVEISLMGQTMHTWDVTTKEGVRRREKHDCDECEPAEDWINKTFEVVHASCGLAEFPAQNGEVEIQQRLVLELAGGELIQLFSNSTVKSFTGRLKTHQAEGGLNANHPLKLELVRRQSKGIDPVSKKPRSYYWLNRPE